MIAHVGKVSLEVFKTVQVKQKEEVDGEVKEVEKDLTVRFDFLIPMGAPYTLTHEVIADITEELKKMEEESKKQADSMKESADVGDEEVKQ